jgi:hypothetical protein
MCMRSAVRRSSRASITARRKRLGAARALRRCGCKQKHPVSSDDRTMVTQRGGGRQRWRTMRWGCHLANGGARLGTACPAVVGSRGKVSAGTAENRETQQRGGDAQRRRGITRASAWTCVCAQVRACAGSETRRQANAQRHTAPERKGKDSGSKQGGALIEEGSGTCKATGSARWLALKRRRVCAAARSGRGPTAGTQGPTSTPGSFQPRLVGRFHSKVKRVEGSPCASGHDSRMVVMGSTKGEAERSRKQNRDGVEVLGWSGSWAVRSVASRLLTVNFRQPRVLVIHWFRL